MLQNRVRDKYSWLLRYWANIPVMRFFPKFSGRAARQGALNWSTVCLLAGLVATSGRTQTVPVSGLVGHWAGDGNANDSSSFANHGSFSGTYAAGISGQAFQVSSSDYVSAPDAAHYSITSDFSVGFWFYGSLGGALLGQDEGGGALPKWFVDYGYLNPGVFNLHLNGSSGLTVLPSNAISPSSNAWHSFALVKNGTAYTFYFNGSAIGTQTSAYSPFPDPTAPFTIGFSEPAAGSFNGLIDEVVFYNRALSGAEVLQLAGVPEPETAGLLVGILVLGFCCHRILHKGRLRQVSLVGR